VKELLVVFHTQSGATARLARAAFEGACTESDCCSRILPALEAGVADLRRADGVLFCTPENFGYISGGMKDFLDRTFYSLQGGERIRSCAILISAGNDGTGAVRQMQRILRGYPMREVAEAVLIRGVPDEAALQRAHELGAALAAGLALGIF
jgi:multimeric flavodoxin WrbA